MFVFLVPQSQEDFKHVSDRLYLCLPGMLFSLRFGYAKKAKEITVHVNLSVTAERNAC